MKVSIRLCISPSATKTPDRLVWILVAPVRGSVFSTNLQLVHYRHPQTKPNGLLWLLVTVDQDESCCCLVFAGCCSRTGVCASRRRSSPSLRHYCPDRAHYNPSNSAPQPNPYSLYLNDFACPNGTAGYCYYPGATYQCKCGQEVSLVCVDIKVVRPAAC